MQKKWLFSLMFLLAIPVALADVLGTLGNVWQKILSAGSLSFLGVSGVVPMTRLLLWVLIFTIMFAVATLLSKGGHKVPLGFLSRSQAMVVAAVIATISAIFLPAPVLLAVGTGWATVVALLLIGGPIVGLAFLLWLYPGKGEVETKKTVLLKLILCLLLFWILSAMKNAVVLN